MASIALAKGDRHGRQPLAEAREAVAHCLRLRPSHERAKNTQVSIDMFAR